MDPPFHLNQVTVLSHLDPLSGFANPISTYLLALCPSLFVDHQKANEKVEVVGHSAEVQVPVHYY